MKDRPATSASSLCATALTMVWSVLAAALLALAGPAAQAQSAAALAPELEQQVRGLAQSGLRVNTAGERKISRVEIGVGALDSRLRLAPCQRVEPYLLSGTRLWGKTRIGLRCTQGATAWNVFLPITVKVYGPSLVAAAALPAGSVLGAGDVLQAEVDLAEDASSALRPGDPVVGRTLAQPLQPGQALRQAHLKSRQWFAAGETVAVLAVGPGFSVAGEGQALSNGIEGQPARVRTEGGRIVSGLPVGERRVEIGL